jgi:hypothetical protein
MIDLWLPALQVYQMLRLRAGSALGLGSGSAMGFLLITGWAWRDLPLVIILGW